MKSLCYLAILCSIYSCKTASPGEGEVSTVSQTGTKVFPFNVRVDQTYTGRLTRFNRSGGIISTPNEECKIVITKIKEQGNFFTVVFSAPAPKSIGGGTGSFAIDNTIVDAGRIVRFLPEGQPEFSLQGKAGDVDTEKLDLIMDLTKNSSQVYNMTSVHWNRPEFAIFSKKFTPVQICQNMKLVSEESHGDGI